MKYFCVIGNPIKHSISPRLHNIVYKTLDIKASYLRLSLKNDERLRDVFFTHKLDGANITYPYKEIAFSICDEVFGIAKKIGAVNTILKKDNKLFGFNTDAAGFMKSIEEFKTKNVLVLGAGGAAKAISFALKDDAINVDILNRSEDKLNFFNKNGFRTFTHHDNNLLQNYDLIINTTSAGLNNSELPAPKEILEYVSKNAKYAYDVIYNKNTEFINFYRDKNVTCKNGFEMLLFQAAYAFNIFFDNEGKEDEIANIMKRVLLL